MSNLRFLLVLFCFMETISFAQTPSADCSVAGAQKITVGQCGITFNANQALGNPASPTCLGWTGTGQDGWGWFTATGTSTTISYTNTNRDAQVYVYASCGGAQLACADDVVGTGSEVITLPTTIGTNYFIRVVSYSGTNMTGTICVVNPPSNDNVCSAVSLTPGAAATCGTNVGAGSAGDYTASCYSVENGLWYTVNVATVPATLSISTSFAGTNYDTQVSIYSSSNNACTGSFTELACDDNSGALSLTTLATAQITTVGTYFVQLDGFAGATGNFCIQANLASCSDGIQNQNENGVDCGGVCPACVGGTGYLHPTLGLQNSYNGSCMVSTCAGTYYDNGGSGSNYSNSINSIYRTFCPDQAGRCLTATFTSFNLEEVGYSGGGALTGCYDYLTIGYGPTQNSPVITGRPTSYMRTGAENGRMCGSTMPVNTSFTSTDASGCLTFRFRSDGSVTRAGWGLTFSCAACATGPNGTDNNDCINATLLCTDGSFTGASTGPGISSEGCAGCNISENFSSWYKIIVSAPGTMALNIVPNNSAQDYDFALYRSNSCTSLGSPVRCSYAATSGTTGMRPVETDTGEDVYGNGWVDDLAVNAGDVFYLMVNKWDPGGSGFQVDWVFSGGASISCSLLPIELVSFTGVPKQDHIELRWEVKQETNLSNYIVQKQDEGSEMWKDIGMTVAGGSNAFYVFGDENPVEGNNYYRLVSVDLDGTKDIHNIIVVPYRSGPEISIADHQITIDGDNAIGYENSIEIYTVLGQKESRYYIIDRSRDQLKVDISNLQPGSYILRLAGNRSKLFFVI